MPRGVSKRTEDYRNEVTVHLVRITSELAHIREKVEENHSHLKSINGRLRTAENNITAVKTIGSTLTVVIGVVLTWLGVSK